MMQPLYKARCSTPMAQSPLVSNPSTSLDPRTAPSSTLFADLSDVDEITVPRQERPANKMDVQILSQQLNKIENYRLSKYPSAPIDDSTAIISCQDKSSTNVNYSSSCVPYSVKSKNKKSINAPPSAIKCSIPRNNIKMSVIFDNRPTEVEGMLPFYKGIHENKNCITSGAVKFETIPLVDGTTANQTHFLNEVQTDTQLFCKLIVIGCGEIRTILKNKPPSKTADVLTFCNTMIESAINIRASIDIPLPLLKQEDDRINVFFLFLRICNVWVNFRSYIYDIENNFINARIIQTYKQWQYNTRLVLEMLIANFKHYYINLRSTTSYNSYRHSNRDYIPKEIFALKSQDKIEKQRIVIMSRSKLPESTKHPSTSQICVPNQTIAVITKQKSVSSYQKANHSKINDSSINWKMNKISGLPVTPTRCRGYYDSSTRATSPRQESPLNNQNKVYKSYDCKINKNKNLSSNPHNSTNVHISQATSKKRHAERNRNSPTAIPGTANQNSNLLVDLKGACASSWHSYAVQMKEATKVLVQKSHKQRSTIYDDQVLREGMNNLSRSMLTSGANVDVNHQIVQNRSWGILQPNKSSCFPPKLRVSENEESSPDELQCNKSYMKRGTYNPPHRCLPALSSSPTTQQQDNSVISSMNENQIKPLEIASLGSSPDQKSRERVITLKSSNSKLVLGGPFYETFQKCSAQRGNATVANTSGTDSSSNSNNQTVKHIPTEGDDLENCIVPQIENNEPSSLLCTGNDKKLCMDVNSHWIIKTVEEDNSLVIDTNANQDRSSDSVSDPCTGALPGTSNNIMSQEYFPRDPGLNFLSLKPQTVKKDTMKVKHLQKDMKLKSPHLQEKRNGSGAEPEQCHKHFKPFYPMINGENSASPSEERISKGAVALQTDIIKTTGTNKRKYIQTKTNRCLWQNSKRATALSNLSNDKLGLILNEIWNMPQAEFVKKDLHSEFTNYYRVIKNPMFLETIGYKLRNKIYERIEHCVHDFRRVFYNSKLYNDETTIYFSMTNAMIEKFDKLLEQEFSGMDFSAITGNPSECEILRYIIYDCHDGPRKPYKRMNYHNVQRQRAKGVGKRSNKRMNH